ncbi:SWIB domain-containing protein [Cephalotus follicularis]|uniref:SWIB domain-containing protein n=1 Tax=Cephalotus follicularis TaxID=3775 RepID=A0A1Q3D0Q2_CEPFO|nr:SWIB domain-containing protein [Cephalotus follicularis]
MGELDSPFNLFYYYYLILNLILSLKIFSVVDIISFVVTLYERKPKQGLRTMLPQRMQKAITDNPKKLANLIDLVNLPSTLREFVGQSQISRLGCFMRVWSYIKTNNLQDPNNKNVVNCDEKLRSILLGKRQVELAELPALIKLHFPKEPK